MPVVFSQSVSLEYLIKRSRKRFFVRARKVLVEGGRGRDKSSQCACRVFRSISSFAEYSKGGGRRTGRRSMPVVFFVVFRASQSARKEEGGGQVVVVCLSYFRRVSSFAEYSKNCREEKG